MYIDKQNIFLVETDILNFHNYHKWAFKHGSQIFADQTVSWSVVNIDVIYVKIGELYLRHSRGHHPVLDQIMSSHFTRCPGSQSRHCLFTISVWSHEHPSRSCVPVCHLSWVLVLEEARARVRTHWRASVSCLVLGTARLRGPGPGLTHGPGHNAPPDPLLPPPLPPAH